MVDRLGIVLTDYKDTKIILLVLSLDHRYPKTPEATLETFVLGR